MAQRFLAELTFETVRVVIPSHRLTVLTSPEKHKTKIFPLKVVFAEAGDVDLD